MIVEGVEALVFFVGGLVETFTTVPGTALPDRAWRLGDPSTLVPVGPTDWERPPICKHNRVTAVFNRAPLHTFCRLLGHFLGTLLGTSLLRTAVARGRTFLGATTLGIVALVILRRGRHQFLAGGRWQ